MSSNPGFAQAVGGQTPEQAARSIASQRGIDLDGVKRMMGGM